MTRPAGHRLLLSWSRGSALGSTMGGESGPESPERGGRGAWEHGSLPLRRTATAQPLGTRARLGGRWEKEWAWAEALMSSLPSFEGEF